MGIEHGGDRVSSDYLEKEKEKLYRIGIFSKMNQVTIKALRYYDEVGLLKPRFIDPENGYRYYSSSQLPMLHQLLALKKIGYSIEEIQKVQSGTDEKTMLQRKKKQLLEEIAEKTRMLSLLEGYMEAEKIDNPYHVIIKELPEVIVASMRRVVSSYGVLFSFVPEMGMEMEKAGCVCAVPEYCFNIYHDGEYKEENIDVEICEAVTKMKKNTSKLIFKTIPEEKMAVCVMHKGPYENFPKAYEACLRYIEGNGYEITGPPRESYIDGIWNKDSEADWLTEIQFPVKQGF